MKRFLDHYNEELRHLRESGQRFAIDHPQVASELGMYEGSAADPFVERLLEGVAFLTARIQSRLDREGVEFAQQAMARVAPLFSCSTPSMTVIALHPDTTSPDLHRVQTIPRGSIFHAQLPGRSRPVTWSIARATTLWPMRLEKVECTRSLSDIPSRLAQALTGAHSVLRMRFLLEGMSTLGSIVNGAVGPLHLTLCGDAPRAYLLHRTILSDTRSWYVVISDDRSEHVVEMPRSLLRMSGLADAESLLPGDIGALPGLRLLREYFAQPARFLAVELDVMNRLASLVPRARSFDVVLALRSVPAGLLGEVDASHMRLFATPAINLFPKRLDPVPYDARKVEQWIPVDRLRPNDYHLWRLSELRVCRKDHTTLEARDALEATGYGGDANVPRYSLQRELGTLSMGGGRDQSDPLVTRDYVSISLPHGPVQVDDVASLISKGYVVDRGWHPRSMHEASFQLTEAYPVKQIECLWPASQPRRIPDASLTWNAVSQIGQSPLALQSHNRHSVTERILQTVALACDLNDANDKQRLESIRDVHIYGGFSKAARTNPMAWVRCTNLQIDISDSHHPDGGAWLFGRVVSQALAESVSLNDAFEVTLMLDGETVSVHTNSDDPNGSLS